MICDITESPFNSDAWREIGNVWSILSRRAELARLCRWAARKRLPYPYRLYRTRLLDEELRLSRAAVQRPRLTAFAGCLHAVLRSLFPPPRYYRRGSARHYTRRFLTGQSKRPIVFCK
jgi:hypothetical protein